MIFIAITFIAAFLIEGLGTLVSVIGLSTLFGSNPIIIALAIALDVGKLVVVALLYKNWHTLGRIMKTYGLIAATVTMVITSAGAAGYLSSEFQKAIVGTQEVALKVDLLKQEQSRLQQRKQQIDQQIAELPERFTAAQRVRMINQFKTEQTAITTRLAEIDKELPTLQVAQINTEAKAGPILYIAKAFDISVEEAVKYVILMIIFVFDPLAVFLIVAGNFLLEQRKKKPEENLVLEKAEAKEDETPPADNKDVEEPVKVNPELVIAPAPAPAPVLEPQAQEAENQSKPSEVPLSFREPEPPKEMIELEPKREEITYSALTGVRPDPSTQIDEPQNTRFEVGYGTGVFTTGSQVNQPK